MSLNRIIIATLGCLAAASPLLAAGPSLDGFSYKNSGASLSGTYYDDSTARRQEIKGRLDGRTWSTTANPDSQEAKTLSGYATGDGFAKNRLMTNYSTSGQGNIGKFRTPPHRNVSGAASQSDDMVRASDLGSTSVISTIINALTGSGGTIKSIDGALEKETRVTTTGSDSFLVVRGSAGGAGMDFTITQDLDFTGGGVPDYTLPFSGVVGVCANGVITGCAINDPADANSCVYWRWHTNGDHSVYLSRMKNLLNIDGTPLAQPYATGDMEACSCVTAECGVTGDDFGKIAKITSDVATGAAATIMAHSNASLSVNKALVSDVSGAAEVRFFGSKIDGAGSALDTLERAPDNARQSPDDQVINLGDMNLNAATLYGGGDDQQLNAAYANYRAPDNSLAGFTGSLPVFHRDPATQRTCEIKKDSMIDPNIVMNLVDISGDVWAEKTVGPKPGSLYLYAYSHRISGGLWSREFTINVLHPEYIKSVKVVSAWNVDDWYAVSVKGAKDPSYKLALIGPGHSSQVDPMTGKLHLVDIATRAPVMGDAPEAGKTACDPAFRDWPANWSYHPLCGGPWEISGGGASYDSTLTGFVGKVGHLEKGAQVADTYVSGGVVKFKPVDITPNFREKGEFKLKVDHWIGGKGQMNVLIEIETHNICIPIDKAVQNSCQSTGLASDPNCILQKTVVNGMLMFDQGRTPPPGTTPPLSCKDVVGNNGCSVQVCKSDWLEKREYICKPTDPQKMITAARGTAASAIPLAEAGSYVTDPDDPGRITGMQIGTMATLAAPDVRTSACTPLCRMRTVAVSTQLNSNANTAPLVRSDGFDKNQNLEALMPCDAAGLCPMPEAGQELYVSEQIEAAGSLRTVNTWQATPDENQRRLACVCPDGLNQAAALLNIIDVMKDDLQCLADPLAPIEGSQGAAALQPPEQP